MAGNRSRAAVPLGAVVTAAGLVMVPVVGAGTAVPAAVACGALVFVVLDEPGRAASKAVAAAAAAVSLTTSVLVHEVAGSGAAEDAGWGLVEVGALTALVVLTTRWATGTWSWLTVLLLSLADSAWILRHLPDERASTAVLAVTVSGIGSALAVAVGLYPRAMDRRTARRVRVARSDHRRQLERDLHDYVAHDLSTIVAQAQSATFASGDDPAALRAALQRIEDAGLKAMESMDTALQLLRTDPTTGEYSGARRRAFEDLVDLVAQFDAVSNGAVRASFPPSAPTLSPLAWETLYRCAAEALTNVHRHASGAGAVVELAAPGPERVQLRVANVASRVALPRPPGTGGTGLDGLAARVEALGGTLAAGPTPAGWEVEVNLPVGHGRGVRHEADQGVHRG